MVQGIESINNMQSMLALRNYQGVNNLTPQAREKVKEEFLALFYKELLKQAFKPPNLGWGDENNTSFSSTFGSDLMVEKLAVELAQSKTFSAANLFPTIEKNK